MRQLNKRVPLFLAIFIWVMFAVSLLWAVFVSLWFLSPADKVSGAKPLVAIVTASLTTVGGIGAVAYLVMKFRERQDKEKELEQEEANQRRAVVAEADRKLNDAIEQLGSESPQVRLAGVYALADVADNYLAGYKQRVVDILCGYLRTDRSDQLIDGKFKDAAVESAIIKVIGEHLRKDREELEENVQTLTDEQLWCDCRFDFRGATFTEPVLWEKTLWNKTAFFSDSEFSKGSRFQWAKFAGDTWFLGASFAGYAEFDRASFAGFVGFGKASFAGFAWFSGARFAGYAGFNRTSFISMFYLEGITFEEAPKTEQLLLANPAVGTGFGDNWNSESYTDEWTLEKKTECLKEVYKRFYTALYDHPQKTEKLAGIQKTISENFPDVTLDFKILEAEAEKVLEERRR